VEKKMSKKKALLAASVAGLIAATGMILPATSVYAEDVHCTGINACKGTGECGGKGHSCAGQNACKGQGWVKAASEKECTDKGGTVPSAE